MLNKERHAIYARGLELRTSALTRQHFKTSQAKLHIFVRHAVAVYVELCKSDTFEAVFGLGCCFFKVDANNYVSIQKF